MGGMGGKIERSFRQVRDNITMGQYSVLGESEDHQVGRLTRLFNSVPGTRLGCYSLQYNKKVSPSEEIVDSGPTGAVDSGMTGVVDSTGAVVGFERTSRGRHLRSFLLVSALPFPVQNILWLYIICRIRYPRSI